jgi:hypothetical protein
VFRVIDLTGENSGPEPELAKPRGAAVRCPGVETGVLRLNLAEVHWDSGEVRVRCPTWMASLDIENFLKHHGM